MRSVSGLFSCLLIILSLFSVVRAGKPPTSFPNTLPVLDTVSMNRMQVMASCPGTNSSEVSGSSDNWNVELTAHATDVNNDPMVYWYKISVGRIINARDNSSRVTWDLTGVKPGEYTVIFYADDGAGFVPDKTSYTSMNIKVVENDKCSIRVSSDN